MHGILIIPATAWLLIYTGRPTSTQIRALVVVMTLYTVAGLGFWMIF